MGCKKLTYTYNISQLRVVKGGIYRKLKSDTVCYRFHFNGKENDNEVKGDGNSVAFEFRIYDTRLGRFLSLDPLTGDFPWNSPYNFAEASPILFIDHLGLGKSTRYVGEDGKELANTKDGNNSTVTVSKKDEKNFETMKKLGEKNKTIDNPRYNMFMIDQVTPANKPLYFSNKSFGIAYMRYAAEFNNVEFAGYLTKDKGLVVLPRMGIDSYGDKFINTESSSYLFALPMKNNVINVNGVNHTAAASIHTHNDETSFSGFPIHQTMGGKVFELPPSQPGDAQIYPHIFLTKINTITDHYIVTKNGAMNMVHFNIQTSTYSRIKRVK